MPGESSFWARMPPASLRITSEASTGEPRRSANTSNRTFVFGFTATFALLAGVPAIIGLVTMAIHWEPIGVDIENEPITIDLTTGTVVDLSEPVLEAAPEPAVV